LDKKRLIIYLEIMSNLLMIIRKKDVQIYKLEMEIRELKRVNGNYPKNPSFH